MRSLCNISLLFALLAILFSGCTKEDVKIGVNKKMSTENIPTMLTRDVKTLISDSGMTKYRITAKVWYVYDEVKVPVWKFPQGLYLEKFDNKFKVEAHIRCDSATYFKNQKLWRLDGDVEIKNTLKEEFLTEQLFWNQADHKVYSDSFIHINKSDRIIEGYGFESNERMTVYHINKPSGIFPVDEDRSGLAKNE